MNPIQLFKSWYEEELKNTKVKIPTACCLSTMGTDGYPNARIVSWKEIADDRFVITGPVDSRKGKELQQLNKAALTFWWTNTERQVRIQGDVSFIPDAEADSYFHERPWEAQIVSSVSDQGQILNYPVALEKKFHEMKTSFEGKEINRPAGWGGFSVDPLRMEFMQFRSDRFHERKLFSWEKNEWQVVLLQP